MGKRTFWIVLVLALAFPSVLLGWSYRGHVNVTEAAIRLLPEPLGRFYQLNHGSIAAHSVDPDLWVENKTGTPAYAHYIDMDLLDDPPFDGIPKEYADAVRKFGEEKLKKAGTLPWEIARRQGELTASFREGRWGDVAMQSSWLSHFVADSTMPLHTTKNYLGQLSGNLVLPDRGPNRSVHHRLEWGLLETFPEHYDRLIGRREEVKKIDDVLAMTWKTLKESYGLIPEVLSADKKASDEDSSFGPAYYEKLDSLARPTVDRQLKRAQELVASVWLSAWEDAGKPEPPTKQVVVDWEKPHAGDKQESLKKSVILILIAASMALILVGALLRTRRRRRN